MNKRLIKVTTIITALAIVLSTFAIVLSTAKIVYAWNGNVDPRADCQGWSLDISTSPSNGADWTATPDESGDWSAGNTVNWEVNFSWDGSSETDHKEGTLTKPEHCEEPQPKPVISHANCEEVLVVMPQAPQGLQGTSGSLSTAGPQGQTNITVSWHGYFGHAAKWKGNLPNLGNGSYTITSGQVASHSIHNVPFSFDANCWETPTPIPTPIPTPTPTPIPTPIPTPTPTPTPTPGPTPTPTPTPGHGCPDPKPTSAPTLSGFRTSSTSIMLTWNSVEPLSHYMIRYGKSSGNYEFAALDVGNTNLYEVKDLEANVQYFFQVAGVNGCAPGDWSNEITPREKILGAAAMTHEPVAAGGEYLKFLAISGTLSAAGLLFYILSKLTKRTYIFDR